MRPLIAKTELGGKRRLLLSPLMAALLGLGMTGFITLVCVWIQPGSFLDTLRAFYHQPLLILLNWFPVIVLTAVVYFLLGNLFYAGSVSGVIAAVLSYVNLLKIEGREDPFVPGDILLIREAMNAAGEYQLDLHWEKLAGIVVLAALGIVLGVFIKSPRLRRWPVRIVCAVLSIAVFAGAVRFVYTDKKLYESFKVPYAYNIPSVFNTLGFNYCFWYNYNLYPVDKPDGYSHAEVESWDQAEAAARAGGAAQRRYGHVRGVFRSRRRAGLSVYRCRRSACRLPAGRVQRKRRQRPYRREQLRRGHGKYGI